VADRRGLRWRFIGGSFAMRSGVTRENPEVFSRRYIEVKSPVRLVLAQVYERMRNVGEAVVTVAFEESGGRTLLTLHQLFPSKEALDGAIASGMEDGMRESYDQLDTILTSAPGEIARRT
jgi:uncharacterized protein YndB with AHSA1/START domain